MFQIYDYTTPNIKLAIAVLSATQIKTDLLDIEPKFEHFILNHFKSIITNYRQNNTKFIVVYDLASFPFIIARLDLREPLVNDADQLGDDMMRLWIEYDKNKVMLLAINPWLPHTGLKHIAF